jgi:hypothetical protein
MTSCMSSLDVINPRGCGARSKLSVVYFTIFGETTAVKLAAKDVDSDGLLGSLN